MELKYIEATQIQKEKHCYSFSYRDPSKFLKMCIQMEVTLCRCQETGKGPVREDKIGFKGEEQGG